MKQGCELGQRVKGGKIRADKMCGHLRLFNLPWQDNLSIALPKKCKVGKDRRKVERDYMTTLTRPHNQNYSCKKNGKRQHEGRYNVCTITSSYPSLQDHITSNTLSKNEKEKNTNTRKRRNEADTMNVHLRSFTLRITPAKN